MDLKDLYHKAYSKKLSECACFPESIEDNKLKLLFYGIKTFNYIDENDIQDADDAVEFYDMANLLKLMMMNLTPIEFMNLFPITKEFDGARFGYKDYYSAKAFIDQLEPNESIGEAIDQLLWEYHNSDIMMYFLKIISLIDFIRVASGEKTLIESFLEEEGIDIVPVKTQKVRPQHLRVIK